MEGETVSEIVNGNGFEIAPRLAEEARANGLRPVLVTDPPFNVGYHYRTYRDRKPEAEYWRDLAALVRQFDGAVIVHYPEALDRLSIELGEPPVRRIAWVYPSNTKRQHRDAAFYGIKPDFGRVRRPYYNMRDKRCAELYKRTGGAKSWDWLECNMVKNCSKDKTAHPCQMPVEVMRLLVGILPDGCALVDPFAGSGTTLVAADALGVEIDESYCEIIRQRTAQAALGLEG